MTPHPHAPPEEPGGPAEQPASRSLAHVPRAGRTWARSPAGRVSDLLPALALVAAAVALLVPSATIAARVDLLLAVLVLTTALGIDPGRLAAVRDQWGTVLLLAVLPLVALAAGGWVLAQFVHGDTRAGVLALGLSPTEVASVGLIGLMGGAAEVGIAVLTVSLVLSAAAGPPALALLGGVARAAPVLPLVGRFALVVVLPLLLGLLARAARPQLARRDVELSAVSSLAVVALVYASLSGARGGGLAAALLVGAGFLALSTLVAVAAVRASGRRLDRSLGLTVGMRDFAVGAALAGAAAGAGAARVAGAYGVLMLVAGASATGLVRRRARGEGGAITGPGGEQPAGSPSRRAD